MASSKPKRKQKPTQNEQERVVSKWLCEYGHFCNPKKPEALNVLPSQVKKLCCTDKAYIEAVSSIQELDYNLEELCEAQHGRPLQFDGIVGPATLALLDLDRCGCPDYPGVDESTGTDGAAANLPGSGGWLNCDPTYPDNHSIRIRIETGRMPAKFKAYLTDVLTYAEQACAEIGLLVTFYIDPTDSRDNYNGYQYWTNIPGGTIGVNMLPGGNTCRKAIWGKMDTAYTPDSAMQAARLQIHEMEGHGINLPHTRGGIMNPSILWRPNDRPTYINDPSFARLKRYYGGKPVQKKKVFVDFWYGGF